MRMKRGDGSWRVLDLSRGAQLFLSAGARVLEAHFLAGRTFAASCHSMGEPTSSPRAPLMRSLTSRSPSHSEHSWLDTPALGGTEQRHSNRGVPPQPPGFSPPCFPPWSHT
jgi:hypothetical protein